MINLGIIGFGLNGLGHCLGFDRLSDCQIIAVADSNKKQLEMSGDVFKRSSPKLFTNYKDLLKLSDVHAVVIATPTHFHSKITIDA